jgi:ribosome recycling factor
VDLTNSGSLAILSHRTNFARVYGEASMLEEIISELNTAIEKAQDALKRELSKLRTGRAHPGMLESIRVDYYGVPTPISQMAAVNVPEPRLLTIKAWEKSAVQAIDRALRESSLGLNPQVDGDLIRVPVPPLSEERRKDLTKLARKNGEDCKIAVRKARHDAIDMLSELKSDASEDAIDRAKKKVEEIVSQAGLAVDAQTSAKEKEILTV